MISWRKNLFYLIVILQVCLTCVSAQGDLNVTSPGEVANSSLADEETPTPMMNVQNDQETPQKPAETQPPTPAASTEAAEETVKPTRQPNLVPTTPPPVVRSDPTTTVEQEKKDGPTKGTAALPKSDPTKKADGGHAGISVANLALVVFSVSALLIY